MLEQVIAIPALKFLFLIGTGIISGLIDSVAGGGGLINLPVLILILGAGPHAIGTNKIAGAAGALMALIVYMRAGHYDHKRSLMFTIWIGIGAFIGSKVSPHLPHEAFRWILFITCPAILLVVLKKDLWVKQLHPPIVDSDVKPSQRRFWKGLQTSNTIRIVLSGLACGFYDGTWGPGGGTFMFLSLLVFAKLPLFTAIAASKLANTCSASVALASYAWGGYVYWTEGSCVALGMTAGAWVGAHYATKKSIKFIRPVLVAVVALLLLKLATS